MLLFKVNLTLILVYAEEYPWRGWFTVFLVQISILQCVYILFYCNHFLCTGNINLYKFVTHKINLQASVSISIVKLDSNYVCFVTPLSWVKVRLSSFKWFNLLHTLCACLIPGICISGVVIAYLLIVRCFVFWRVLIELLYLLNNFALVVLTPLMVLFIMWTLSIVDGCNVDIVIV